QSPARGPQGAPRDRVSAGFGRLDERRDVLIFFDIVGANEDRGLVLLVLFSADLDRGVAEILVVDLLDRNALHDGGLCRIAERQPLQINIGDGRLVAGHDHQRAVEAAFAVGGPMAAAYDVGNLRRRGESTSLAASAAAAKERGAATSTRLAAARRNILIMMHSSSSLGE